LITIENLTDEQKEVLYQVSARRNVLVDACIGSGKTTVIQLLCSQYPEKKILYLTFNALLKADAKEKIRNRNVTVTNYHGFAYSGLKRMGISVGVNEQIRTFNRVQPYCGGYHLLVIDEYQDISSEIAGMLWIIKKQNPDIQIVAVGDMWQKIYDSTTLDVLEFMENFLGEYELLRFTKCFRISPALANRLSKIWGKQINGVNQECEVLEIEEMEVYFFLAEQNPKDVLCIGRLPTSKERLTGLIKCLNILEDNFPEKYNKYTTYATIRSTEKSRTVVPDKNTAIFTNYDKCKGLEKPVCVIFDYSEEYWVMRTGTDARYEIVRNLFCVAASRGKQKIIFVKCGSPLSMETICEETFTMIMPYYNLETMFGHKYSEDIERCWEMLSVEKIQTNGIQANDIFLSVKDHDALIDLTPCIELYQMVFFKNYSINKAIDDINCHAENGDKLNILTEEEKHDEIKLQEAILTIVGRHTGQARYIQQTKAPFISEEAKNLLFQRLSAVFSGNEEIQKRYEMEVTYRKYGETSTIQIYGRAGIRKENSSYNLFYTEELSHEKFLITAFCMALQNSPQGIVWNTKKNEMYRIEIPDMNRFLKAVIFAVTKQKITENEIERISIIEKERENPI